MHHEGFIVHQWWQAGRWGSTEHEHVKRRSHVLRSLASRAKHRGFGRAVGGDARVHYKRVATMALELIEAELSRAKALDDAPPIE